jgi:hypothetical protein
MGAPIVVNTVKVQGTVTSTPSGTAAIIGTVSQNATWNVNAIQSGNWNVGGTVNQGGSWTVTANVGSGTWPVTAIQSGNWFVGGTVTATNANTGALFVQGTTTATNLAAGALYVQGTTTATIPASAPGYVAGTVTMGSASAGFVQGTVTALPGVSATSLGKAEDAGFTTGDVGVMALAVRNDSGTTSLTSANLDYSPISVDFNGRANVIERGSAIAHGSAAVSASAQILAASQTRRTAVITNLGTDYVWLGASGVASGSGLRLAPGQTAVIDRAPTAAVHGVAQSGTQSVAYFTESD